jgi:hypothetical protein
MAAQPGPGGETLDHRRERALRNEEFFRGANQAILREAEPAPASEPIEFLCECASLTCADRLRLAPREWRNAHEDDRTFVVVPGHEVLEVERIVRREERYTIVEKLAPPVSGSAPG